MTYDEDMVNTINAEDQKQYIEERHEKNRILAISNAKRKAEQWQKYFPTLTERNDDYLLGNVY